MEQVQVEHAEGRFAGVRGLEIFWQSWQGDAPPRGVVVISHGAGEHSGRYERPALELAELGYPVYALDHRGHGRSGGPRALVDRLDNAAADLDVLSSAPGASIRILRCSCSATAWGRRSPCATRWATRTSWTG